MGRDRMTGLSWRMRIGLVLGLSVAAGATLAWLNRESIVRNIVGSQLDGLGIQAQYDFESIAPSRQTVRNLVIGDPAHPDATISRMVVESHIGLGTLQIDRVRIEGLRAYGHQRDGKISFGALDPLLYGKSDTPFELPDFALELVDARARIDSDFGAVGIKASGAGELRDGFRGEVAAISSRLDAGGCSLDSPSLFLKIGVTAKRPDVAGPLRFDSIRCASEKLTLGNGAVGVNLGASPDLTTISGQIRPELSDLALAGQQASSGRGTVNLTLRNSDLSADYILTLFDPQRDGLRFKSLAAKGDLTASHLGSEAATFSAQADLTARALAVSRGFWQSVQDLSASLGGTPVGPVFKRLSDALREDLPGGDGSARVAMARTGAGVLRWSLANLMVRDGADDGLLFDGHDLQLGSDTRAGWALSGGFATGGRNMPKLEGTIAPHAPSGHRISLSMRPYGAPGGELGLSRMVVDLDAQGRAVFSGLASVSGPLPGGSVRDLTIPLQGRWSADNGLAMFDDCITLRFDSLVYSSLSADAQAIRACPTGGGPIVRQDAGGVRIAANFPSARLTGKLGQTRLKIDSKNVALQWPGNFEANGINVLIGDAESGTHIAAANISATLGSALAGKFDEAEAYIGNIPLLLTRGRGDWGYRDGVLALDADQWYLRDRDRPARFQPLIAHNATLRLENNRITASGLLREPQTDRAIVAVEIAHNLDDSTGHADLQVEQVRFDDTLQPEMVTSLALGVIANVKGALEGTGRIDWTANGVTSLAASRPIRPT